MLCRLQLRDYILLKLCLELLSPQLVLFLTLLIVALLILLRSRVSANLVNAEFMMVDVCISFRDKLKSCYILEEGAYHF